MACPERTLQVSETRTKDAAMFTTTLLTEIARQRQTERLAHAERHHRLFRRPLTPTSPHMCEVIDLPVPQRNSSPSEALSA